MGEPQLSSVATLPVFVRHLLTDPNEDNGVEGRTDHGVITSSESLGLAFSDDSYTTGVPETTGINATIKLIQVINSKKSVKSNPGFKCEIVSGNEGGLFNVTQEDHGCGIQLIKHLDYENKTAYSLDLRLTSHKYFINPQKSTTTVKIIVQDENDNAPEFIFNRVRGRKDTFYDVVNPEMDIDTPIMQVRATDRDSGKFGMIRYKIFDEDDNNIGDENLVRMDGYKLFKVIFSNICCFL